MLLVALPGWVMARRTLSAVPVSGIRQRLEDPKIGVRGKNCANF